MINDVLSITITTKDKIIFHEDVKAITSYNEKGIFDILAEHTNFITMIKNKVIIHKKDGTNKEINVDNGILKVIENKVNIFIGLLKIENIPT